jgi:peptidyl-prolyl cis-trans isomerase D
MFDFVRQHTKIMQFLLFLLIFPSFVLFGIDGYNRFLDKGEVVASVDGQKITQPELDNAHRNEVDRMKASMPNVDSKMFDSPMAKLGTLERLVRDRVMRVASERLNLQVSDQRLAGALAQNPAIASLKRADGTLDINKYKDLLASQGMTPESFEAQMRNDLASQQVLMGVSNSVINTNALIENTLNAYYEKRSVQIIKFAPSDFLSSIKPTSDELNAYYQSHSALFQSPEQASIEYVVLDLPTIQKSINLSEADLKTYFEQNQSKLAALEQRRASHILLNAPKEMAVVEKEKIKIKALDILSQIKKSPDQFGALAKQYSQDPGSASKGGDLDFFARGAMVKPFEDVAFSLNKGQISELVETDFGYHIIKLTDIKTPPSPSFEATRASLETELKKQQSQKKFAEVAEQFTNLVYEQSDSLKPVVDKFKLTLGTIESLNKIPSSNANASQLPWLQNPKFLNAVFSVDSVEKKHNTEAIEVAPNTLVAARIREYRPAKTKEFALVKEQVEQFFKREKSELMAKKQGEEKLNAWKTNPESANLPASIVISREKSKDLSPKLIEAALRAPIKDTAVFAGVDLGAEGYAVIKVLKVEANDVFATDRSREKAQFGQWLAQTESLAYYSYLKDQYKVTTKTIGFSDK